MSEEGLEMKFHVDAGKTVQIVLKGFGFSDIESLDENEEYQKVARHTERYMREAFGVDLLKEEVR
jgi:hypothetical protein